MDVDLRGKFALVTGAARGIGLVVAEQLAREGVNVCGIDTRAGLLKDEMGRIAAQYTVETLAKEARAARRTVLRSSALQVLPNRSQRI